MGMKSIRRIFLCVFLLGAQLFGQTRDANRPAATAPALEVSAGYVFMSMSQPSLSRLDLNGVDANGLVQFSPRWGATADFTFARAGNVPGTNHSDNVFSGLVGPVFFLRETEKTAIFVHALAGLAWIDSAVPVSSTAYFSGWETRFSYALGGGVERVLFGPFSVRATGDYQKTTFVNSTLALQKQNNLRVTTSIVYRFGGR